MATYSTGISVTWGGVAFTEVTAAAPVYAGGPSKGRSVVWTDDAGTCTVECFGTANVSSAEYGLRKQLVISGGGVALTTYAVYLGFTQTPELNAKLRHNLPSPGVAATPNGAWFILFFVAIVVFVALSNDPVSRAIKRQFRGKGSTMSK